MNEYHSKNSISKIINYIFLALIPLYLFGFYKNGFLLYNKNLVGIYGLFKPLIYPLLGFLIGLLIDTLLKPKKSFKNSFLKLYGFIIGLTVSINLPIYLFLSVIIVVFLIFKLINYCKLNIIAISSLLFIIIMYILNIDFANSYESVTILNYSFGDKFLGMNIGGLGITSIVLSLIGYGYLCFCKGYKKEIPITFLLTFILLGLTHSLIISDINIFLDTFLRSTIIFGSIFIATDTFSTPIKLKNKIIYGITLSILTYLISLFLDFYIAIYLGILILNICYIILTKTKKIV